MLAPLTPPRRPTAASTTAPTAPPASAPSSPPSPLSRLETEWAGHLDAGGHVSHILEVKVVFGDDDDADEAAAAAAQEERHEALSLVFRQIANRQFWFAGSPGVAWRSGHAPRPTDRVLYLHGDNTTTAATATATATAPRRVVVAESSLVRHTSALGNWLTRLVQHASRKPRPAAMTEPPPPTPPKDEDPRLPQLPTRKQEREGSGVCVQLCVYAVDDDASAALSAEEADESVGACPPPLPEAEMIPVAQVYRAASASAAARFRPALL